MTTLKILEGGKNRHFKAKVITRLKHQIRPILGLNFKMLKTYQERLYCHITVVPCNEELESPPNISKMIRFWKMIKMAILPRL